MPKPSILLLLPFRRLAGDNLPILPLALALPFERPLTFELKVGAVLRLTPEFRVSNDKEDLEADEEKDKVEVGGD